MGVVVLVSAHAAAGHLVLHRRDHFNVLKDELPEQRKGHFLAFLPAAALYTLAFSLPADRGGTLEV